MGERVTFQGRYEYLTSLSSVNVCAKLQNNSKFSVSCNIRELLHSAFASDRFRPAF